MSLNAARTIIDKTAPECRRLCLEGEAEEVALNLAGLGVLSAASGAFGSTLTGVLIRMSGEAVLVCTAREDRGTCPSGSTAGLGVAGLKVGANVGTSGEGDRVGVANVPGIHVGAELGSVDGRGVGDSVGVAYIPGIHVGTPVSSGDGTAVGTTVGNAVGTAVGGIVGGILGGIVGIGVGPRVGAAVEGITVAATVGMKEGMAVG